MTRTYALRRLLEHGPMSRAEIVACTGWPADTVGRAIQRLMESKRIRACGLLRPGFLYEAV